MLTVWVCAAPGRAAAVPGTAPCGGSATDGMMAHFMPMPSREYRYYSPKGQAASGATQRFCDAEFTRNPNHLLLRSCFVPGMTWHFRVDTHEAHCGALFFTGAVYNFSP